MLGFRKRTRIPEFEESLAHLQEELALTETYASAMMREGHYKAALAILDEQRTRVARAESVMLAAFRPRSRRVQVAIGGLAAVMMLGGASFAAFNRAPDARSTPEIIERAEDKLDAAVEASSDRQVEELVAGAVAELRTINSAAAGKDTIGDEDFRSLESRIRELIAARPHMRQLLARRIAEIKAHVKVDVPDESDVPSPPPSPKPDDTAPKPQPSSSPSGTPSAEPQPAPLPEDA